ncbi:MAG TPA: glycosyltransferase, partial [Rhodocyclaceae bacterium]|nr:glycosyltransferase [Rhodocyclaceae bacterium]
IRSSSGCSWEAALDTSTISGIDHAAGSATGGDCQPGPGEPGTARDILVIVPAFRNPAALELCVAAVSGQTVAERISLYVRDNSLDNVYYTAAVNEGLKYGLERQNYRYFVVLTQDCRLASDAIERLVQFMEEYPGVGIVAPIQLDPDNPEDALWVGSQQSFPEGKAFQGPHSGLDSGGETVWANGAAFMVKREVLLEIGLLDENMRFVCSDADFSFSARARGWQVVWIRAACCYHKPGGALRPNDAALMQVIREDTVYFADKWITGALFRKLEHRENAKDQNSFIDHRDAIAKLAGLPLIRN